MKSYRYNLAQLGAVLKEARARRGWSQEQVAAAAGLSRHCVGRMESGTDCPLVSSVAAIVAAVGADPSEVLQMPQSGEGS